MFITTASAWLVLLLGLVWYVLVVAGAWKMFEKAGIAGWKAIIPIYNIYLVYKLCWEPMYFWIWLAISFAGIFLEYFAYSSNGLMYWIVWVLSLVQLLILCNCCYRLSAAFGHGIWYGLGLYFFPFIFTMILGFGSSRYIGQNTFAHN